MSISNFSDSAGSGQVVVPVPPSSVDDQLPTSDRRLFTVDEYHRMGEAGIFDSEERLELIEGVVFMMSPIGSGHFKSVTLLQKRLGSLLPDTFDIAGQQPLQLIDSEPVPDVMVLRGAVESYTTIPQPSQVAIAIEVSDATRARDRRKIGLYAAAAIPEYWIVDLQTRQVEIHGRPTPSAGNRAACYESLTTYSVNDVIDVVLDDRSIGRLAVKDILP